MSRESDLKAQAAHADPVERALAARAKDAPPELLYYLAGDKDEAVRCAAAGNDGTPILIAPKLQMDESQSVRAALVRKLGRVLHNVGERQQALSILTALAGDISAEVRAAVAVTLQDTAFLPPVLARQLAEDSDRSVAAPILRFSLSLSDADLVALVKNTRRAWVPVEVAQRRNISNDVALAVWESGNSEAAVYLLGNASAQTPPDVLDEAVTISAIDVPLQLPLVHYPHLSSSQIGRLAEFVDGSLLDVLAERAALDRGTLSDVSAIVRRRLDWAAWRKQGGSEEERARALYQRKQLDSAAVSDAVAWGERDFVIVALALLAEIGVDVSGKIIAHQSPKAITALCWKAGLTMRCCRMVQIRTARVPGIKALNAKDGIDYPMPVTDMQRHLELYGL